MNAETSADWRDEIFVEVLQTHDIKQVHHVPDAGHSRLIEQCQRSNSIRTVPLTTEEGDIRPRRRRFGWPASARRC